MILAKRLKGKAIAALLGPSGEAARKAALRIRDSVTKAAPRRLELYLDIADPWSYLAAQAAERLLSSYPVDFAITVITPPASDVDPMPLLRAKHAVRDAHTLAAYWNLSFHGKREGDPGMIRDVGTSLIRTRPAREQLSAALELLGALWDGDKKRLATLLGKWGAESHGSIAPYLNGNYDQMRKTGHYQGAMFRYDHEWYWGVDRLPYLEAALAETTSTPVAHVLQALPEAERGPHSLGKDPLTCELWFSFRSPYSYLALEQIEAVLAPFGVPLVLRPIAPMVTRGLAVPPVKRMYIVRDAKREANRLGIPFGTICDPLGPAIDHLLAIQHWATKRSAAAGIAFAHSATRGIWTEAKDLAEYVDLREIVERAGLPWDEAKAALGSPEAAKAAVTAAADLAVVSLWGVPSFRIGELVTWGNDRLPMIADALRRHGLARTAAAAAAAAAPTS